MLLEPPVTRWECPNCDLLDVTRQVGPHTRMHACRGLGGLTAPMVHAGTRANVRAHEREDYIGSEIVQMHQGRPVMSVTVERDDGQDALVFAPLATTRS